MIKKGSMFLIFFLGLFYGSQALAWNAYHLYNKDGTDIWAIECADGTLHSYAGSSAGLSTVGPELCKNHGGVAGPGGELDELPAEACKVSKPNRPVRPGRPIGGRSFYRTEVQEL